MSVEYANHFVAVPSKTRDVNLCSMYGRMLNIEHNELQKAEVKFYLLDGDSITLSASDFAQAFIIVSSNEFDNLCIAINDRESAFNKAHELYNDAFTQDAAAQDCLYEVSKAFEALGRAKESVATIRENIIDRVGWTPWINACRLYEGLYSVERDYLG